MGRAVSEDFVIRVRMPVTRLADGRLVTAAGVILDPLDADDVVAVEFGDETPATITRRVVVKPSTAAQDLIAKALAAESVHGPAHQVVAHPDDPREPGRAAALVPAGVSDLDDLADVDGDAASRDDELVPGVDQDRG